MLLLLSAAFAAPQGPTRAAPVAPVCNGGAAEAVVLADPDLEALFYEELVCTDEASCLKAIQRAADPTAKVIDVRRNLSKDWDKDERAAFLARPIDLRYGMRCTDSRAAAEWRCTADACALTTTRTVDLPWTSWDSWYVPGRTDLDVMALISKEDVELVAMGPTELRDVATLEARRIVEVLDQCATLGCDTGWQDMRQRALAFASAEPTLAKVDRGLWGMMGVVASYKSPAGDAELECYALAGGCDISEAGCTLKLMAAGQPDLSFASSDESVRWGEHRIGLRRFDEQTVVVRREDHKSTAPAVETKVAKK